MSVPRLRMVAGPNGSGKSTIKSVLPSELLGVYLNPDEIEADKGIIPLPAEPRVIKIITDAAFSKPAQAPPARKPSPAATTRKSFSSGEEVGPLRRHAYGFRGGLFGT
jgi:hypothetical protein